MLRHKIFADQAEDLTGKESFTIAYQKQTKSPRKLCPFNRQNQILFLHPSALKLIKNLKSIPILTSLTTPQIPFPRFLSHKPPTMFLDPFRFCSIYLFFPSFWNSRFYFPCLLFIHSLLLFLSNFNYIY